MRCLHATDHGGGCAGVRQSVRREQETFSFRLPLNEHMSCKKCDLYRWDGCEVRLSDPCPRVSRVCPGSPWSFYGRAHFGAPRAGGTGTATGVTRLPRAPSFRRPPPSSRRLGRRAGRRSGSGWRQGRVRWGWPLLSRPRGAVGSGPVAVESAAASVVALTCGMCVVGGFGWL